MIDYQSLRSALFAGGLRPNEIESGRLIRCPVEGDKAGKKSGAYRLFDDDFPTCAWWNWKTNDSGVWVSKDTPLNQAEIEERKKLIEAERVKRHQQQLAKWKANKQYLLNFWNSAEPVGLNNAAGCYLTNRGLVVPITNGLKFINLLDYWDGANRYSFPAMLGAVTNYDSKLIAIHRTYLTSDGYKAPVPTPKKLTKTAGYMAGASIKLGAPALRPDGTLGLGVAEGIETAIAASMLSGVPVWSCISANGLASFKPPKNIRNLYIFADNDKSQAGQEAAEKLTDRLNGRGLVIRTLLPSAVGDWADELLAMRANV